MLIFKATGEQCSLHVLLYQPLAQMGTVSTSRNTTCGDIVNQHLFKHQPRRQLGKNACHIFMVATVYSINFKIDFNVKNMHYTKRNSFS